MISFLLLLPPISVIDVVKVMVLVFQSGVCSQLHHKHRRTDAVQKVLQVPGTVDQDVLWTRRPSHA